MAPGPVYTLSPANCKCCCTCRWEFAHVLGAAEIILDCPGGPRVIVRFLKVEEGGRRGQSNVV